MQQWNIEWISLGYWKESNGVYSSQTQTATNITQSLSSLVRRWNVHSLKHIHSYSSILYIIILPQFISMCFNVVSPGFRCIGEAERIQEHIYPGSQVCTWIFFKERYCRKTLWTFLFGVICIIEYMYTDVYWYIQHMYIHYIIFDPVRLIRSVPLNMSCTSSSSCLCFSSGLIWKLLGESSFSNWFTCLSFLLITECHGSACLILVCVCVLIEVVVISIYSLVLDQQMVE